MQFQITLSELPSFARQFWKEVGDARVFALHGAMGAGKTTLTAALCRARGVEEAASSPTFSIINEYAIPGSGEKIYHIDLYRLKDESEVAATGVEDCIFSGAICLVEWPEKAPDLFDAQTVHVYIEPLSETLRSIRVNLPSAR